MNSLECGIHFPSFFRSLLQSTEILLDGFSDFGIDLDADGDFDLELVTGLGSSEDMTPAIEDASEVEEN